MKILVAKSKDGQEIETIGKSILPIYYTSLEIKQMIRHSSYSVLKIVENDFIVGFVVLEKQDHNIHICSIGIHKQYQRLGLGTKLLTFIKNKYKNDTISLNVHVENKKGIGCYEKNGFEKKKLIKEYYQCFCSNNDAYYMVFLRTLF